MAFAPSSLNPERDRKGDQRFPLLKHKGRSIREGLKVASPILVGAFVAFALSVLLELGPLRRAVAITSVVGFLSAAWIVRFFRDFQPAPQVNPDDIVSPAHGIVDCIDRNATSTFLPHPCTRISIYLSLKNVHVQYAPLRGKVIHTEHIPGKRQRAIHQKASLENEHLLVVIASTERPEARVAIRLIAGVWVRRIVPWFVLGDVVSRSERLGLIRFGSRVDVYLPAECELLVHVGERVVGGETALARPSWL